MKRTDVATHHRRQVSARRARGLATAAGLITAVAVDRLCADPSRYHPVALFGTAVSRAEKSLYAPSIAAGGSLVAVTVLPLTAATLGLQLATRRHPIAHAVTTAVCGYYCLGGESLARTGGRLATALEDGDEDAARQWIPWLCSRDPESLDSAGMARAGVESVAENSSDAVTGTLFWGAVLGPVGMVTHRAINTLDAMIGYRNERYERFGKVAAHLDDLVNALPARLCAALTVGLALRDHPAAARRAVAAWRRDAAAHPSPNAGCVEATAAGALGVTLGGETIYPHGVEQRPHLGEGPAPQPADLQAMVTLSRRLTRVTAVVAAGLAVAVQR